MVIHLPPFPSDIRTNEIGSWLSIPISSAACMMVLNDINWGKHKVYFRRDYFCPLTLTYLLNAFSPGPFGFKCPDCRVVEVEATLRTRHFSTVASLPLA